MFRSSVGVFIVVLSLLALLPQVGRAQPAPAWAPRPAAPAAALSPAPSRRPAIASVPPTAPGGNDSAWPDELPPADAVDKLVHGNAADAQDRRDASLEALIDYIRVRSDWGPSRPNSLPPVALKRWQEYARAQSTPRTGRPTSTGKMTPVAERYFSQLEFRIEVLKRLLSPASVAAYQRSAPTSAAAPAPVTPRPTMSGQARDQETGSNLARQIQADIRKAKKEHATLLGVPLGVPLNLSQCPPGIEPLGFAQVLQALGGEPPPNPSGAVACWYDKESEKGRQLVFLQRPSWVLRSIEMNLAGQVLFGATLMVQETEDLYKQLQRKYGPPTSRAKFAFQNAYGASTERLGAEWSLPGIYVNYTPQAGMMQYPMGNLQVQFESVHQASQRQKEAEEDNGAKL